MPDTNPDSYDIGVDADAIIAAVEADEPVRPPKKQFPPREHIHLAPRAWRETA
jgi:hypothetical protein